MWQGDRHVDDPRLRQRPALPGLFTLTEDRERFRSHGVDGMAAGESLEEDGEREGKPGKGVLIHKVAQGLDPAGARGLLTKEALRSMVATLEARRPNQASRPGRILADE